MTYNNHQCRLNVNFVVFSLMLILSMTRIVLSATAADIPAVKDKASFGAIDGEFSMKGYSRYYHWNVIRNWTEGQNAIRSDNTFGVANGKFTVRTFQYANTVHGFNDGVTIQASSDETGAIFYPDDQSASFSLNIAGNYIKYISMSKGYHLVGTGENFVINVVTKNGYLTCADDTDVSFFALSAEQKTEGEYGEYRDITLRLYEPGTYNDAYLLGTYQNGRIVLNPRQKAIIRSPYKVRLEDGTVLQPNEEDIYQLEVRDGIPFFVNVTIETTN